MVWSPLSSWDKLPPDPHPCQEAGQCHRDTECLQWWHYWRQRWYKGSDPAMELPRQAALPAVGWVLVFP